MCSTAALSAVGRIFVREIWRWQPEQFRASFVSGPSTETSRPPTVRGGAVCFPQRFGGSLNLNVHYHVAVPDSVFGPREGEVALSCEAVGVSRSAYYAWRRSKPSARQQANERVLAEIRAIHVENEARYGSPRMRDELRDRGHEIGKHRVARLMRENGLWARVRRRFRHTTDSRHKLPIAPNLLGQRFTATAPNQAWVGDITYIWTAEGWRYLAVLIDLYSRRVVGWALRKSLNRELAIAALLHALTCRKPPPGLVQHTDRGCQYASYEYRALLDEHGVRCSMSAAGNCYDGRAR